MRWLMASTYRYEYRDLLRARDIPEEHAPDVIETHCPRCGELY